MFQLDNMKYLFENGNQVYWFHSFEPKICWSATKRVAF